MDTQQVVFFFLFFPSARLHRGVLSESSLLVSREDSPVTLLSFRRLFETMCFSSSSLSCLLVRLFLSPPLPPRRWEPTEKRGEPADARKKKMPPHWPCQEVRETDGESLQDGEEEEEKERQMLCGLKAAEKKKKRERRVALIEFRVGLIKAKAFRIVPRWSVITTFGYEASSRTRRLRSVSCSSLRCSKIQ